MSDRLARHGTCRAKHVAEFLLTAHHPASLASVNAHLCRLKRAAKRLVKLFPQTNEERPYTPPEIDYAVAKKTIAKCFDSRVGDSFSSANINSFYILGQSLYLACVPKLEAKEADLSDQEEE